MEDFDLEEDYLGRLIKKFNTLKNKYRQIIKLVNSNVEFTKEEYDTIMAIHLKLNQFREKLSNILNSSYLEDDELEKIIQIIKLNNILLNRSNKDLNYVKRRLEKAKTC